MRERVSERTRAPGAMALSCAVLLGTVGVAGCSGPEPIFAPVEPPLLWPDRGDPARFAWVGQLSGQADLKAPRSTWSFLVDLVAGAEEEALLQSPASVAVTDANVVYVADPGQRTVHAFDLEQRTYRAVREAGDMGGLVLPVAVALAGDRPVVVDRALHSLIVYTPEGAVSAVLGTEALSAPVGIAVGPVSGRYYVVDVGTHALVVLEPDGSTAFTVGRRGRAPGEFNFPTHVALDAREDIYVSDSLNFRVQVFGPQGDWRATWGRKGDGAGEFSQPKGIALDRRGLVYVVDSHFENFQVFDPKGRLLLAVGGEGTGPGQFWLPIGLWIDSRDRVWVTDGYNRRIQVFQYLAGGGT